ncbi:MAG: NAD(P)H-dependent dehydrogenase/reductase [Desulfuromonas sp.]|nr:MAG: NAD(P)H-dependent dehydrogenase/reductase [Desulfuromonas sp.]
MLNELLSQRRSIRKFESRAVSKEQVELLAEALLRAPSSRNRQPWEFVIIDDPEKLQRLGAAKQHGSAFLEGAPLAVVVAADPDICDVWIEDCSIAAILVQIAAEALGLKSCWVQIRLRKTDHGRNAEDEVREIVGLPDRFRVDCIVGIGHPDENKEGHARADLSWSKIHRNVFEES